MYSLATMMVFCGWFELCSIGTGLTEKVTKTHHSFLGLSSPLLVTTGTCRKNITCGLLRLVRWTSGVKWWVPSPCPPIKDCFWGGSVSCARCPHGVFGLRWTFLGEMNGFAPRHSVCGTALCGFLCLASGFGSPLSSFLSPPWPLVWRFGNLPAAFCYLFGCFLRSLCCVCFVLFSGPCLVVCVWLMGSGCDSTGW